MTFDQKTEFVDGCRRRMTEKGCKACGKIAPQGLFLKGKPQLQAMVRGGAGVLELKRAMRQRGWYCRACSYRKRRVLGSESYVLQDQFDNLQDYKDYQYEFYGPGMDRSLAPKPEDWLAGREQSTAAVSTPLLVENPPFTVPAKSWLDYQAPDPAESPGPGT